MGASLSQFSNWQPAPVQRLQSDLTATFCDLSAAYRNFLGVYDRPSDRMPLSTVSTPPALANQGDYAVHFGFSSADYPLPEEHI